jgi:integrase
MGLYRRGKIYWFRIQHDGQRIQETTGTQNKKLAKRIYAKAVTDVQEGKWFDIKKRTRTFDELMEKYMREYALPNKSPRTIEKDTYSFKRLSEHFSGKMLHEITPQTIADYKGYRRGHNVKPATLAKELELLLLSFSPEWLREIIVFALNTGMRREEILSLTWNHVDLLRKVATLIETKNGEQRTVPLNQLSIEVLQRASTVRNISGYVFPSQNGKKIMPRNLLRTFFTARAKAGLQDVRFHDLRHSFASRMVQAGVDLYVVKELLGHKSFKMTARYAHHNTDSLKHGVEALLKVEGDSKCYNSATVRVS